MVCRVMSRPRWAWKRREGQADSRRWPCITVSISSNFLTGGLTRAKSETAAASRVLFDPENVYSVEQHATLPTLQNVLSTLSAPAVCV